MKENIAIYFKNHKCARMLKDKVVFADPLDVDIMEYVNQGKAVFNWENICFVQECDPRKEDLIDGD